MLTRVLVALLPVVVASCGKPWIWDVWPLTPSIVSKSTHTITGLDTETGKPIAGAAFVVGKGHLVTSASVCMTSRVDSLMLEVHGHIKPVTMAQLYEGLCLVKTSAPLDNGLIIARTMPFRDGAVSYVAADGSTRRGRRISHSEISAPWQTGMAGAPVVDGCGVVGVLVGPRAGGEAGSRLVTLGALQRFLLNSGVDFEVQPEGPDGIDMGGNAWPSKDHADDRDGNWQTDAPRPAQRGGCR